MGHSVKQENYLKRPTAEQGKVLTALGFVGRVRWNGVQATYLLFLENMGTDGTWLNRIEAHLKIRELLNDVVMRQRFNAWKQARKEARDTRRLNNA
jgi:hypothetical protein